MGKLYISSRFPKSFEKEELYHYFKEMNNGDVKAREKIIYHNILLVLNEVNTKFSHYTDLEELFSVGLIGLIKSVDTFNIDLKFKFSTYAAKCIDNEILMFLKKTKKFTLDKSLESLITTDQSGNQLKLEDVLADEGSDFVSDYEKREFFAEIREVVYQLPLPNRDIVLLYFGFIGDHAYNQKEIAEKFNISQSYVSRIITKNISKIGEQLRKSGIIEINGLSSNHLIDEVSGQLPLQVSTTSSTIDFQQEKESVGQSEMMRYRKNKIIEERSVKKMKQRKIKTIYEYLKEYSRDEIDVMLVKLTEDEKNLIELRYGKDLDNPIISSTWGKEETRKFYNSLIPKMKKLLFNSRKKGKEYDKKQQEDSNINISSMVEERTDAEIVQLSSSSQIAKESKINLGNEGTKMEKEDYLNVLKLMRSPKFDEILKLFTPKEAIIVCLKLGYVDEKYFTTEAIANFLGIELDEVREITKKALLIYKENINQMLDEAIEIAVDSSIVLKKKKD